MQNPIYRIKFFASLLEAVCGTNLSEFQPSPFCLIGVSKVEKMMSTYTPLPTKNILFSILQISANITDTKNNLCSNKSH